MHLFPLSIGVIKTEIIVNLILFSDNPKLVIQFIN